MNHIWSLCVLAAASTPVLASDLDVSVTLVQPRIYGRIDVGGYPPPQLVYPQPIIIERAPVVVARQPVYLHVPPGHAKNWRKHCRKYNACAQPVYFVREDWYDNVYAPHHGHGEGHGNGSKDGKHGKAKGHKDG